MFSKNNGLIKILTDTIAYVLFIGYRPVLAITEIFHKPHGDLSEEKQGALRDYKMSAIIGWPHAKTPLSREEIQRRLKKER